MLSEKQIRERIILLEKELEIYKNILETPCDGKFGRPLGSTKYNSERLNFLKQCESENLSDSEIIKRFNSKFGTNFKDNSRALYNLMQRQGIRKIGWRFGGYPTRIGNWEKIKNDK